MFNLYRTSPQPSGANFDDLKTFFLLGRNFICVPVEFLIRQEYLQEFIKAKKFFSVLPQNKYILWNDGPKLKKIDHHLSKMDLAPAEKGKGRNIWYCMGFVISLKESGSVAMHDCDIVTYDKNLVAKLFYPVANPKFSFDFCKGFTLGLLKNP